MTFFCMAVCRNEFMHRQQRKGEPLFLLAPESQSHNNEVELWVKREFI